MLTFGFATLISIKKTEGKNVIFVVFQNVKTGHFCSCPNSNADILQKSLTFCVYRVSQFEGFSSEWSQPIVKAMFA